ncbi:dTDP-4-dehydrorhamnose reductase [Halopenitus malekzadehii]|nr:dTDP-4-dehydrorhamnose reductase [Halopenitus malekzadehii]
MRLLVVGANGLLGSNVVYAGQQRGWDVCGTYHSTRPDFDMPLTQFDLGDYEAFGALLEEYTPDVVVNCAAMTDVDGCERDPEQAQLLNGDAPGGLATHCEAHDVKFLHISTDYVFDGTVRDPYVEETTPNPVQAYGESKLAGERAVRSESETALIARLSFVWGIHRSAGDLIGFPAWVRNQLRAGEAVPLFTDQWVTPTRAGQAAGTLLDLIAQEEERLYHVACASCMTPYEFGTVIAEQVETDSVLVCEGSIADVDRAAIRPKYTCLDVGKVTDALERAQPTVREDVEAAWELVD